MDAIPCIDAREAIDTAREFSATAIRTSEAAYVVVDHSEAESMEAAGLSFCYVGEAPDRFGEWHIVLIPVESRWVS